MGILGTFEMSYEFQHTAARRRLGAKSQTKKKGDSVSTHSRPKAAGYPSAYECEECGVSTHSRPKAAGAMPITMT